MDLNHFRNFGGGYYGKHLSEIILILTVVQMMFEDLIFSSGVQNSRTIFIECIVGNIHAKSL